MFVTVVGREGSLGINTGRAFSTSMSHNLTYPLQQERNSLEDTHSSKLRRGSFLVSIMATRRSKAPNARSAHHPKNLSLRPGLSKLKWKDGDQITQCCAQQKRRESGSKWLPLFMYHLHALVQACICVHVYMCVHANVSVCVLNLAPKSCL